MPSPEPTDTRPPSGAPAWIVFSATLLAEYLTISYAVDAQDLLGPADLQSALRHLGELAPLGFVFLAAVFLTGGAAVRGRLGALASYRDQRGWSFALGAAHLALFAGSVAVALHIASFGAVALPVARLWLALWLGMLLASWLLLLLALWTPLTVVNAVQGLRRELAIGAGVAVAAWVAGLLARSLWKPLGWLTLELVHALLSLIASDPVASIETAEVGTRRFYVVVAGVCSGVEGMGLMLTFVAAYLYIDRRKLKWPHSLLLLPLSTVLVWLLNVVRVTALIAVGTWVSPAVALGGFHSKAGWVFFTLAALATVLLAQRGRMFALHPSSSGETKEHSPQGAQASVKQLSAGKQTSETQGDGAGPSDMATTSAYLAPLLAVIATKLVTGLATSGFDYLYPLSAVSAAVALWRFRKYYPPLGIPPLRFPRLWLPGAVGLGVGIVWILGFREGAEPSTLGNSLEALPASLAIPWLAIRVLGSTVTVPIVEELAFRGYLLRRFASASFHTVPYRRFSWLGLIASSVAFGLMHSQWELGVGAGLAFSALAISRSRLSDAVLAHAAANAVIAAYALSTGHWALLS